MKNENVYAVTGIDLGDPFNIHPSDKWPFSGRAAGVALKYIYGMKDSELHPNQKAYGLSPYISSADWTEEGLSLIHISILRANLFCRTVIPENIQRQLPKPRYGISL